MKKEELAYIAGVLDADGSIYISASKSVLNLSMVICGADEGLIDWLVQTLGGKKYLHGKKCKNRRQTYSWRLFAAEVKRLLPLLLPYLRVKKQQAELALCFPLTKRGGKHTTANRELRQEIRHKIQGLNFSHWNKGVKR